MESAPRGVWNYVPTFLYPKVSSYTGIPIVTDIVKALEKRDFRVPDVFVNFHFNGSGMNRFKNVSTIKYEKMDIRIWFCFVQGSLPGYDGRLNDISGLSECHIPQHSVHFYGDRSGNNYFRYIGNDWEIDKKEFRDMQYQHQLKPCQDFHKWISEDQKQNFTDYLQEFLDYIEMFPEKECRDFANSLAETEEDFNRYKFERYPEQYPTFYIRTDSWGLNKSIQNFKVPFDQLDEKDRIVSGLGGERLVHWRSVANDIPPSSEEVPYPSIANDGFKWAFVGREEFEKKLKYYECKGWNYDPFAFFEIRPHYLDDIYVADLSISNEYRKNCFKTTDSLSEEQYGMFIALRGVCLVTLKEYIEEKMNFKEPQYLIRKDIGYDEVQRIYHIKNGRWLKDGEDQLAIYEKPT